VTWPALPLPSPCRYTPDANGYFAGQTGYGYISIAKFIATAAELNTGASNLQQVADEGVLALLGGTVAVTAILEAGRRSLDAGGAPVDILYDDQGLPSGLQVLQVGAATS
jgi:D-galacturonate reductase